MENTKHPMETSLFSEIFGNIQGKVMGSSERDFYCNEQEDSLTTSFKVCIASEQVIQCENERNVPGQFSKLFKA